MEGFIEPRVALVHDWLTGMRGGEKCLEVLCERWPDAPLLTLLHLRGAVSPAIESRIIQTTILQRFPRVERYYRYLLPMMPWAASTWRVPSCDLVVSTSHCVAKAVRAPAGVPHICYCFTPMRYAWHMRDAYFREKGDGPLFSSFDLRSSIFGPKVEVRSSKLEALKSVILDRILRELRSWDRRTAEGVTHFIAISRTVKKRIQDCYQRDSTVIYPPVDTDFYCPGPGRRQGYYLVVSAFAPYKRIDLAITACNRLRRPLVLIGEGQEEAHLRSLGGNCATFLGRQPDEVVRTHLRSCKALLFPGEEDFGIVPVEAMACGTPVIALGRGGACETVIPLNKTHLSEPASGWAGEEPTGVWFDEQSSECLIDAIQKFESFAAALSPQAARKQALRFNRERFKSEFFRYVASAMISKPPMPSRLAA